MKLAKDYIAEELLEIFCDLTGENPVESEEVATAIRRVNKLIDDAKRGIYGR
jgi:hypothetical protein